MQSKFWLATVDLATVTLIAILLEISAAHHLHTPISQPPVTTRATTMELTIILPTHQMPVELLVPYSQSSFGFSAADSAVSGEEEQLSSNSKLVLPQTTTTTIIMLLL